MPKLASPLAKRALFDLAQIYQLYDKADNSIIFNYMQAIGSKSKATNIEVEAVFSLALSFVAANTTLVPKELAPKSIGQSLLGLSDNSKYGVVLAPILGGFEIIGDIKTAFIHQCTPTHCPDIARYALKLLKKRRIGNSATNPTQQPLLYAVMLSLDYSPFLDEVDWVNMDND